MTAKQSQAVYQAVVYDAPKKPLNEPLLSAGNDEDEQVPALDETLFGRFKFSSLLLGLLIGFFIQFSTLGANFLVITIWGEDVITKSKSDIVAFSLLWSFFTSAMAIVILGFLRNLVSITYSAVTTSRGSEDTLDEMVLHMECRFVVGSLVGVCLAWTMTDVLLGMRAQIVYSLVTLVVALFWCKVMMMCFANNKAEKSTPKSSEPMLIV